MSEAGNGKQVEIKNPPLRVLYINPSGGCNLHCRHCWVNEGISQRGAMPLEHWKSLLGEAADLGCRQVKLTGGEPLLYPGVVPLYLFAAEVADSVVIETNGTLEPAGLWEALAENPPQLVSVSIDSASATIHDQFRGAEGCWKKSVSFAEKLVQNRIHSQIIMSVSRTDRQPVTQMIHLAEKLGVDSMKINFITPSGRGASENFYSSLEIKDVLDFFKWFADNTPEWVKPSVPAALMPLNRLKGLGYCPVKTLLGVLPDGTFSLCGVGFSRAEMSWGRYPETSVRDVWLNSPVLKAIRNSLPGKLQGVCGSCIHRDSCLGRCVVNNNETGGSLISPDAVCQAAYDAGLFPETRMVNR